MKEHIEEHIKQRLASLEAEFEAGQKMLAELEAKEANLRETLLRISGAIQVLKELSQEKLSQEKLSQEKLSQEKFIEPQALSNNKNSIAITENRTSKTV